MSRSRKKMWRNGPGGRWTRRIIWFDDGGQNIRLQCETPDGVTNLFPECKEEADCYWNDFKEGIDCEK